MTDADRIGTIRAVTRGPGVVLGWHVLLVAAYLLWAFLQPAQHSNPASCDGLGWGRTPNPRDGALLLGIFCGAPALSIMVAVSAILTITFAFRFRPGWKAGTAGTLITWLVAAGALVAEMSAT